MRTLPTATELIVIVADALRDTELPWTVFHRRVAANALAIAEREIQEGPKIDAAIERHLSRLEGCDQELDLALAIRSGEIAIDRIDLLDMLWVATRAELAIDQPGYPTVAAIDRGYLPDV